MELVLIDFFPQWGEGEGMSSLSTGLLAMGSLCCNFLYCVVQLTGTYMLLLLWLTILFVHNHF